MLKNNTTKSSRETKAVAKKLIGQWLKSSTNKNLVICLHGDLGAGKTTFVQGLAEELGIKEIVNSPTFLIMKKYTSVKNKTRKNRTAEKKYNLYHFDCYRISGYQEVLGLGWEEIISGKNNIIAIEWPEKIKEILPKEKIEVKFKFIDKNARKIEY